ncbi:MAG: hypothetical protein Q8P18_26345 [Pseudomonadota bacterium]|nr:hypothetical protein [Pseudomonadota bacterium]
MNGPARPWLFRVLLLCVLALVCGVNAYQMHHNPMPPLSSHRTWQLVPKMMHYFMGYDHRRVGPNEPPQLSCAASYYTLPTRRPIEWNSPTAVIRELQHGGRLRQLVGECTASYATCMPHAFAVPAAVGALFPGQALLVLLVPTFYFLLLLLALYGIGVEASGPAVGVAAAAIGAGYPGLFGMARWHEGYIVTTALSASMVWCLIRSRGLTRWLPVAGFCALAWTAIRTGEGFSETTGAGLAVAGPFLVASGVGLVESVRARRLPWRTLVGLAIVAVFLWQTTDRAWVTDSLFQMTGGLTEEAMNAHLRDPNASPLARKAAAHGIYVLFIVNDYLRPPMVAWLLVAIPLLVRGQARHRLMLAAWFLVTFIGYSSMARKSIWYPIPMLAPLAVITAVGLGSLAHTWRRTAALGLAGATGLAQLLTMTIPALALPLPDWVLRPVRPEIVQVRWVDLAQTSTPVTVALHAEARRLLAWIDANLPPRDELLYVGVVTPWLEDATGARRLGWYLTLHRPDVVVVELGVDRYIQGQPYQGLSPRDFALLVCLEENGHLSACGPSSPNGRGQGARAAPAAYAYMVNTLLARSRGAIPGLPDVLLLRHPATDALAASEPAPL